MTCLLIYFTLSTCCRGSLFSKNSFDSLNVNADGHYSESVLLRFRIVKVNSVKSKAQVSRFRNSMRVLLYIHGRHPLLDHIICISFKV